MGPLRFADETGFYCFHEPLHFIVLALSVSPDLMASFLSQKSCKLCMHINICIKAQFLSIQVLLYQHILLSLKNQIYFFR